MQCQYYLQHSQVLFIIRGPKVILSMDMIKRSHLSLDTPHTSNQSKVSMTMVIWS